MLQRLAYLKGPIISRKKGVRWIPRFQPGLNELGKQRSGALAILRCIAHEHLCRAHAAISLTFHAIRLIVLRGQVNRREIKIIQIIQKPLNPQIPYSTIFGTMKRPLAFAGALRSASSFEREGWVSSGRVTLTRGKACAVGSTPDTSTSLSFSM